MQFHSTSYLPHPKTLALTSTHASRDPHVLVRNPKTEIRGFWLTLFNAPSTTPLSATTTFLEQGHKLVGKGAKSLVALGLHPPLYFSWIFRQIDFLLGLKSAQFVAHSSAGS